jgi:hypothetical protein
MKPKSLPPFPRYSEPTPEISPPPGDLPKKFPETTPLSDDGLEAAKRESASTMKEAPAQEEHAGEDRSIESGIPKDDPEQPESAAGDEPME